VSEEKKVDVEKELEEIAEKVEAEIAEIEKKVEEKAEVKKGVSAEDLAKVVSNKELAEEIKKVFDEFMSKSEDERIESVKRSLKVIIDKIDEDINEIKMSRRFRVPKSMLIFMKWLQDPVGMVKFSYIFKDEYAVEALAVFVGACELAEKLIKTYLGGK